MYNFSLYGGWGRLIVALELIKMIVCVATNFNDSCDEGASFYDSRAKRDDF